MTDDAPMPPRSIPPRPALAWFLRDLVPDQVWSEFDIGQTCVGEISKVQEALMRDGGRDAWLRCVEQTRMALPQLLSISLFEIIGSALDETDDKAWPRCITLYCRPMLSIYASGRRLKDTITLHCHARLDLVDAGEPIATDYALARTMMTLRHAGRSLIERVPGEFFVPVPSRSDCGAGASKRVWFKAFGQPRRLPKSTPPSAT